MTDGAEVHPADRFTWERIVMRARLEGVITGSGKLSERTGKQTRGGISGAAFKVVALVFAAHADEDGTAVRPGDMRVAILAEVHPRTVKAVREKLIELGLLRQTGRYRHTPMYRLTLPSDLDESVIVLSPTEVVDTAKAMRAKARETKAASRNGWSAGTPKAEGKGVPPVHPKPPDGDPDGPRNGCAAGAPEIPNGCAAGQDMGDPPVTLNQALTGHLKITNQSDDDDLRTAVTGPRATPEDSNPDSPPMCEHKIRVKTTTRADGRPSCALCRVEQDRAAGIRRIAAQRPPPDPPTGRVAPVIPLNSRRTS